MIKDILRSRKFIYALQVFVFAWACASTITISLNMFLWLLNGIFLGVVLYSHHIRNGILTNKDGAQWHLLIRKIIILLKVLLDAYIDVSETALKDVPLSDIERDNLKVTKTDLINFVSLEIAEIEALNEGGIEDNSSA